MLEFLISAIEWAKLIVGFSFVLMGSWSVIRPFVVWTITRSPPVSACIGAFAEILTGIILTLVGFYIAGW